MAKCFLELDSVWNTCVIYDVSFVRASTILYINYRLSAGNEQQIIGCQEHFPVCLQMKVNEVFINENRHDTELRGCGFTSKVNRLNTFFLKKKKSRNSLMPAS